MIATREQNFGSLLGVITTYRKDRDPCQATQDSRLALVKEMAPEKSTML